MKTSWVVLEVKVQMPVSHEEDASNLQILSSALDSLLSHTGLNNENAILQHYSIFKYPIVLEKAVSCD